MCRLMLWAAAALFVAGLPSRAGSPQDLCRVVVYPIHDLMMHFQPFASATPVDRRTTPGEATEGSRSVGYEQVLIEYLKRSIDSQECEGQDCCIDFYPIGQALVVRGTAKVHERVSRMLETLCRDLEPQLEFKMLVVTVPQEFFERFGLDEDLGLRGGRCPTCPDRGPEGEGCLRPAPDAPEADCCELPAEPSLRFTRLGCEQLQMLLAAVSKDSRCRSVSAPTLITRNSLSARTQMQGHQQFLTGLTIRLTEGEPTFAPEMTQVVTGLDVQITGRQGQKDDGIQVEFRGTYTFMDRPPALVPVTASFPMSVHEAPQPSNFPVTQFLQKPSIKRLCAEGEMVMMDGSTMLVYGGCIERHGPATRLPSWLARLPYFDRWLRSVMAHEYQRDHLLYLISARVCRSTAAAESTARAPQGGACRTGNSCCLRAVIDAGHCGGEQAIDSASAAVVSVDHRPSELPETQPANQQMSAPCRLTTVIDQRRVHRVAGQLVAKYHAACAAGDLDLAREYAQMALDLDPACFNKPFATEVAPTSCPTLVPASSPNLLPSSPIVPTGHVRPGTPGDGNRLPGHRSAVEPASERTVDYFPFPLVPIFHAPSAESGPAAGWRREPIQWTAVHGPARIELVGDAQNGLDRSLCRRGKFFFAGASDPC